MWGKTKKVIVHGMEIVTTMMKPAVTRKIKMIERDDSAEFI